MLYDHEDDLNSYSSSVDCLGYDYDDIVYDYYNSDGFDDNFVYDYENIYLDRNDDEEIC